MHIDGLDEMDNQILELIRENARLTYKEIGDRIGLSRVSVKKRMDAMQEKGIIRGYHTIIDPVKAAEGVHFLLDLEVKPENYEEILQYLARCKQIRQIYSVSGDCRLHAVGYAANTRSMEHFANSIYRGTKGVRMLSCRAVMSTLMDVDGGVEYEPFNGNEHLEEE